MATKTITFLCRESKKDAEGLSPLEVCINIGGSRQVWSTGVRLSPKTYSRKPPIEVRDLQLSLSKRFNAILCECMSKGMEPTPFYVIERLRGGGSYTCKQAVSDFLKTLSVRVGCDMSVSVYRKYDLVYSDFLRLYGDRAVEDLRYSDINYYWQTLNQNFKESTVSGQMCKIRTLFKWLVRSEHIAHNPCEGLRVPKGTPKLEWLTEERLEYVLNYDFANKTLNKVRDIFGILAATGLSWTDYNSLKPEDIEDISGAKVIVKKRNKTSVGFVSVILPFGLNIIERVGLPKMSNQKINSYLFAIENISGVGVHLHCHLARKTYATLLINRKVDITNVMRAMGHSTVKTTLQYYAHINNDTVVDDIITKF